MWKTLRFSLMVGSHGIRIHSTSNDIELLNTYQNDIDTPHTCSIGTVMIGFLPFVAEGVPLILLGGSSQLVSG